MTFHLRISAEAGEARTNVEMVLKTIKYNALLTQDTRIQDYMNLKRKIEIELRLREAVDPIRSIWGLISESVKRTKTWSQRHNDLWILFCSSPLYKQLIGLLPIINKWNNYMIKLAKASNRRYNVTVTVNVTSAECFQ